MCCYAVNAYIMEHLGYSRWQQIMSAISSIYIAIDKSILLQENILFWKISIGF